MDRHEQRRLALPHDEDDLRDAFFDGRLDEHAWCELKRELPPRSRQANLELARDLASLAVDGGSLYIGVDERAPDGNPLRPQPLAGLRERVDQVAQSRMTPALFVECYEIRASEQPGYGYLEVVVRASADAPHQVEGIYYGRSDTGKCRLSDQQVERLMRDRQQQMHGAEDGLRALIAADPYQGRSQACPHLFIFARPGVRRTEMCRDVIGADQNWQPLLSLLTGVNNRIVRPMYTTTHRGSRGMLETLIMSPRLITGGVGLMSWPRGAQNPAGEQHHQELRIDEDGDLSLYHAGVGWDSEPVNDVTQKVLSAPTIVGSVREFTAAAVAISHRAHVPGTWNIGIALTGIRGYRHQESDWPDYGPPCTDDEYVRVERFDLAAMERTPGDVADKLLGRLLRGLRANTDPDVKALLTDPAINEASDGLDDEN
jgi:hypothetical protein